MTYKSKSASLFFTVVIGEKKVIIKFVNGQYKTNDKAIIAELDNHIKTLTDVGAKPKFLQEGDFDKMIESEPDMVYVDDEKGHKLYCDISEVPEKWKQLKNKK